MRQTVCFITSFAGANIEPTDLYRKDGNYGSEYALFQIAKRLTEKFNVFITVRKPRDYFIRTGAAPGPLKPYQYLNWISEDGFNEWATYAEPEHVVVIRYFSPFLRLKIPQKSKLYYWLHDLMPLLWDPEMPIHPASLGLLNRCITQYISVGKQVIGDEYIPKWGMRADKFSVIKNGVDLDKEWTLQKCLSIKRRPRSFVYSSSVGKGLEALLEIWPRILSVYEDATLDILYGYDEGTVKALGEYCKKYPSVKYHGKVSQKELFDLYKTTEYWVFKNKDHECNPTTVYETAYYGIIQISNTRGPLIDEVSGFRFDDSIFNERLLETLQVLEENKLVKDAVREREFKFALCNTWDDRASKWSQLLFSL